MNEEQAIREVSSSAVLSGEHHLRSSAWLLLSFVFGLGQVWMLVFLAWLDSSVAYSFSKAAREGAFGLFGMTLVVGIAMDSYMLGLPSSQSIRLLVIFLPFAFCFLVVAMFATVVLKPDALDSSFIVRMQVFFLLLSCLYAVPVKARHLKG